jgi:hypothetical protein
VEARRRVYPPNDIVEHVARPWWAVARDTAADPMLWFLAVTAAIYAALGDCAEAVTLLLAMLPLIGMDALLHRRVAASTRGLSTWLATEARAARDGVTRPVPAATVLPGDLAPVGAGDYFPADGVIVAGAELKAEESALTGESYPVRKHPIATMPPGDEPPVDGDHWGLAGTRLLTGEATLRVVFTGGDTFCGELVRSNAGGSASRTPLQIAIGNLVGVLTVAAGGRSRAGGRAGAGRPGVASGDRRPGGRRHRRRRGLPTAGGGAARVPVHRGPARPPCSAIPRAAAALSPRAPPRRSCGWPNQTPRWKGWRRASPRCRRRGARSSPAPGGRSTSRPGPAASPTAAIGSPACSRWRIRSGPAWRTRCDAAATPASARSW